MRLRIFLAVIAGGIALLLCACSAVDADWKAASANNTTEAYQGFLKHHPSADQARSARERIGELDWQQAVSKNTAQAYETFLGTNPGSAHASGAAAKADDIRYGDAMVTNTSEAYRAFLKAHPNSGHASEAQAKLERIAFDEAVKTNTPDALDAYAAAFPDGDLTTKAKAIAASLRPIRGMVQRLLQMGGINGKGQMMLTQTDYLEANGKVYTLIGSGRPLSAMTGEHQKGRFDVYGSIGKETDVSAIGGKPVAGQITVGRMVYLGDGSNTVSLGVK
jgi:hypothetical protein